MTKKHFIALADAVKAHNASGGMKGDRPFTPDHLNTLARFCNAQNPSFKFSRWIGYVRGENGPNGGKIKGGKQA